ncbi:chemotaxis protein CheF1 [Halorubrum sp. JWXQ-INN 858]|uniref:CheF family chemotaxis protein n=1 Tax=Halorubrum sp. JWXQ-INN 858 TaxID=2690782 RepID=UPI001359F2A7|nr:CheF family chemotaxis protein [Halorubrum sp. JWXQ-INN 858]MWV63626.1 chemotaxis protein CheF1 [Halorubrum sp. JWXQ-INN 858]
MANREGEHKIADTEARFAVAVRDGRSVNDVSWVPGRVLLSNRRLILADNDGKRTVPLSKLQGLGGRHDANQSITRVSNYVSFDLGEQVLLVAAADHDGFERDVYRALLDQRTLLAKHPAVAGGVVQETEWEQARVKIDENGLSAALEGGAFVEFDLDDISGLDAARRTVAGEKKPVIEVSHTDGGTSIETHLAGRPDRVRFVEAWLRKGEERSSTNVDLSDRDREVLMALYSGVSPFEIPAFLGLDVDVAEETFERLIELDVVEQVRVRREVSLNSRGRNIASEAMNEQ